MIVALFQSRALGKYPLLEKMPQLADQDVNDLEKSDARGSTVDDLKTFYDSLSEDKGFKSKLEIIQDKNYVSMVPIALTKGLKYLFGE